MRYIYFFMVEKSTTQNFDNLYYNFQKLLVSWAHITKRNPKIIILPVQTVDSKTVFDNVVTGAF